MVVDGPMSAAKTLMAGPQTPADRTRACSWLCPEASASYSDILACASFRHQPLIDYLRYSEVPLMSRFLWLRPCSFTSAFCSPL